MITVTALNTNYSEIPTGEIDMSLSAFVREYSLTRDEDGTYSAEWGNGDGSDDFEIIDHDALELEAQALGWDNYINYRENTLDDEEARSAVMTLFNVRPQFERLSVQHHPVFLALVSEFKAGWQGAKDSLVSAED